MENTSAGCGDICGAYVHKYQSGFPFQPKLLCTRGVYVISLSCICSVALFPQVTAFNSSYAVEGVSITHGIYPTKCWLRELYQTMHKWGSFTEHPRGHSASTFLLHPLIILWGHTYAV